MSDKPTFKLLQFPVKIVDLPKTDLSQPKRGVWPLGDDVVMAFNTFLTTVAFLEDDAGTPEIRKNWAKALRDSYLAPWAAS